MSAITHPLLFMPVHVQRGAAVATAPLGQQRVLVVAQDYLFWVGGGRHFGSDVLGPCCVQRLNGWGQQLTVTHHDKLTGLRGEGRSYSLSYWTCCTSKTTFPNKRESPYRPGWRVSSPTHWRIGPWRLWKDARRSSWPESWACWCGRWSLWREQCPQVCRRWTVSWRGRCCREQRQDVKPVCESDCALPTPSYISKMFWAVIVSPGQKNVISIEGSLLRAFLNSYLHFLLILACTCLFGNANPGIFSIWTQTCHFSQNIDSPQESEKIFSLFIQKSLMSTYYLCKYSSYRKYVFPIRPRDWKICDTRTLETLLELLHVHV